MEALVLDIAMPQLQKVGLQYVLDDQPGYSRKRQGKGFVFLNTRRKAIRDERVIQRIRSLAIPPAWQQVWICAQPQGHLQATGRDVRGRKQYKYHPEWSRLRNENKFSKLRRFAEALPSVREQVKKDLRRRGLPKDKVLAAMVRVLELGHMRPGNEEYSRENSSYGLTTLLNKHAHVKGSQVSFHYRGKSGIQRQVRITDQSLSRIVKRCQELPGQELFTYQDEFGEAFDVTSTDLNEYLKKIAGDEITAKDFRTWGGTLKAVECLLRLGENPETTKISWKRREVEVIKQVSAHLGNTVSVCRKYYVNPCVFEADMGGEFFKFAKTKCLKPYSPTETVLLKLLEVKG